MLCRKGANVRKKDKNGHTALHYAVREGAQQSTIRYLKSIYNDLGYESSTEISKKRDREY